MCKNKRQSFTHVKRHAEFVNEMGGEYGNLIPANRHFAALCGELVGVDTPEILQARIAHEGSNGYRENNEDTYGMTERELAMRYGASVSMVSGAQDCDQELDETSQALVNATGHNHSEESMAAQAI